MPKLLEQTKTAIRLLRAAGLKRKDFSARCEIKRFTYTDWEGSKHQVTEYGDVRITIWLPKQEQLALIPALIENEIDVTIWYFKDGPSYPFYNVSSSGVGKLVEIYRNSTYQRKCFTLAETREGKPRFYKELKV